MIPTESKSVQFRIIKYATEIGWDYVSRKESDARRGAAQRGDKFAYKSQPYYQDILIAKLREFNSWLPTNYKLSMPFPKIEGNRQMLQFLRGQSTAYDEKEKRERNVVAIDFAHPQNNVFEITDEFSFANSQYRDRQDLVFFNKRYSHN